MPTHVLDVQFLPGQHAAPRFRNSRTAWTAPQVPPRTASTGATCVPKTARLAVAATEHAVVGVVADRVGAGAARAWAAWLAEASAGHACIVDSGRLHRLRQPSAATSSRASRSATAAASRRRPARTGCSAARNRLQRRRFRFSTRPGCSPRLRHSGHRFRRRASACRVENGGTRIVRAARREAGRRQRVALQPIVSTVECSCGHLSKRKREFGGRAHPVEAELSRPSTA